MLLFVLATRRPAAAFVAAMLGLLLCFSPAVAQESSDANSSVDVSGDGYAGVYPDILRGRITASGAAYDPDRMTASHRTLPLGSLVRVIRTDNGASVVVRVNDRGPFSGDRVMDLSGRAARELGYGDGDERFVRIVPAVSSDERARGPADDVHVAEYRVKNWTGGTGFTIQLGSYGSEQAAEAVERRIKKGAWVQRVEVDDQVYYRLNFGRYSSPDKASNDMLRLEREGFFGFVKGLATKDT